MNKEKWKKYYADKRYLISSWGRFFSLETKSLIRPYIHKSRANNYLRVSLRENKAMVHVAVAMSFKTKEFINLLNKYPHLKPEDLQVNHKDRNTLNPNVQNVEWTTEEENKLHLSETSTLKFNGKDYRLIHKRKTSEVL